MSSSSFFLFFSIDSTFGDDMLFPNIPSKSMNRGVAYNQVNKWPSGIVPYDISAITGEKHSFNLTKIEDQVFHEPLF